jgi:hypothetical protein
MKAIEKNKTRSAMRLLEGKKTVGVYCEVQFSDESIESYNARLVDKGFT